MPQIPDLVLNCDGCPVEEEIPPNWMEDINAPTEPLENSFPLVHIDISMGGCMVEEEIPPQWWDDSIQGTTPNFRGLAQ
jgi:hypothetical protein